MDGQLTPSSIFKLDHLYLNYNEEPNRGKKMNVNKYQKIDLLLSDTKLDVVALRWQQWRARYHLYAGFKEYEGFNRWQGGSKTGEFETKFMSALQALNELQANKDKFDDKQFNEMQAAIIRVANIEMSKLEIAQIKKLIKIQGVNRDELKDMHAALLDKREASKKAIEGRKVKFSKELADKNLPGLEKFFQQQEGKIHFNKHIRRMGVGHDALTVAKTGTDIFSTIASIYPTLVSIGQSAAAFLSAIPIISVIAMAIPLVFTSIKTWVQNKSSSKKLGATIAIGLVGAAILTAALAPVAALGMAAGLATVGFVMQQVIPYVSRHRAINALNKEIDSIEARCNLLKDKDQVFLTNQEKHFLLKELEVNWNKESVHTEEDKKELKRAKVLIYSGRVDKNCKNEIILGALNNKSLATFLGDKHRERQSQLRENIKDLQALEKKQIASMVNGVMAVAGAILFCIPTPPTMILGACLMGVSAVVGIAIKYDLPQKVAGFFSKLFGFDKPKAEQPQKAELTNNETPQSTLDLKVENTAEVQPALGTVARLHANLGVDAFIDGVEKKNTEEVAGAATKTLVNSATSDEAPDVSVVPENKEEVNKGLSSPRTKY